MCGRFVVAGATGELVSLFDVDLPADDLPGPNWNIAPTDPVAIILDAVPKAPDVSDVPVRRMETAKWGLVPSWSKDPKSGPSAINARIETVTEKRHFSTAIQKRRALIPATGYYEWRTTDGVKTPYFIHLGEGQIMAFAALYEWWRNPAADDAAPDKWLLTTSILTQAAAGGLAELHDRMPVFLSPEIAQEWLDPHEGITPELLGAVGLGGVELAEDADYYEVSPAVGNVRNKGPQLIEPV